MKTRILTALVGVPLLIFALVVRGWFAELLIVLLTLIALDECYKALRTAGYQVCTWGGYAAAVVMWPLSGFMGVLDPLLLVVGAMGISMLGILLSKEPTFPNASASVYPLFTCLMPFSMFMMMHSTMYGRVPGIALVTMAFGIAYGGDVFAYLGGKTMGKHKLCPTVSPKKTVEGAISGVLGSSADGEVLTGAALTIAAFETAFGSFGGKLLSIAIVLFAFSSSLGWIYQGETAFSYLFGRRLLFLYRLFFALAALYGAAAALDTVFAISDICNALMCYPNLICLLALSGEVDRAVHKGIKFL